MTGFVPGYVVHKARMTESVRERRLLPIIQPRMFLPCIKARTCLVGFACHIVMKFLQCPANYFGLMNQKVGKVVLVRFGVQECGPVLNRSFTQKLRNRN